MISRDFGNGGDQITLPERQETNADEKVLGDVELGWGEEIAIGDFEEVVEEERLELREEQVQLVRKQWVGEEKAVLSAPDLMEESISDQRQLKFKANKDVDSITEVEVLKVNEANKIRGLCRAVSEIPENRAGLN